MGIPLSSEIFFFHVLSIAKTGAGYNTFSQRCQHLQHLPFLPVCEFHLTQQENQRTMISEKKGLCRNGFWLRRAANPDKERNTAMDVIEQLSLVGLVPVIKVEAQRRSRPPP